MFCGEAEVVRVKVKISKECLISKVGDIVEARIDILTKSSLGSLSSRELNELRGLREWYRKNKSLSVPKTVELVRSLLVYTNGANSELSVLNENFIDDREAILTGFEKVSQ